MTPGAVVAMCNVLGFTDTTTTFHSQWHREMHDLSAPPLQREMFTVVAHRSAESAQYWNRPATDGAPRR
jgi:hypothetical protein